MATTELSTAIFNQSAIDRELAMLRRYFTKLRVFIPHYGYANTHSLVQNCVYIIDKAASLGYNEIIWGTTCSEATMTSATYADYATACVTRAPLLQHTASQTYVVGNEETTT